MANEPNEEEIRNLKMQLAEGKISEAEYRERLKALKDTTNQTNTQSESQRAQEIPGLDATPPVSGLEKTAKHPKRSKRTGKQMTEQTGKQTGKAETPPKTEQEILASLGTPQGLEPKERSSTVPEAAILKMVDLRRLGYSYRQIQAYIKELTSDEYSTETIHRHVTERMLGEDRTVPSMPRVPQQDEAEPETPTDPRATIMNQTMAMWNITPEVYFALAAMAYNRSRPNIGAFIMQDCLPWVKFKDEVERVFGKRVIPEELLANMADWGKEIVESRKLKAKVTEAISPDETNTPAKDGSQ